MSSRETDSIIAYIQAQGIQYKVTDLTTPGVHASGSYHYAEGTGGKGLAVDFAGTTPNDEGQMAMIYAALRPQAAHLAELIHNGPTSPMAVRNSMVGPGLSLFGNTVWQAHHNHVHVAVKKGTFLADYLPKQASQAVQTEKVKPVFDPPLQVVDFLPFQHGSGGWALLADGGISAFGDAPWRGKDNQPIGHDYWGTRKAAKFERNGEGYTVISTDGGRYDYP